jgi:FkbM family methyltransferase
MYHWLARRAFPDAPAADRFRWHRDRFGHRFRVHPYYLIDRNIVAFGSHEPELLAYLAGAVRPGSVCIDAGANFGAVTMLLAGAVGPSGRVHAFEPVPAVRARLVEHVAANGFDAIVAVHEEALAAENGTATFHVAADAEFNQGLGSLLHASRPGEMSEIPVRTLRLDDFVERAKLERLDWIKMDVQGAEPLLLAGARRVLERFRPSLVLEVAAGELAVIGCSPRDLLADLERGGYRLFELDHSRRGRPISADGVPPHYRAEAVLALHVAGAGRG